MSALKSLFSLALLFAASHAEAAFTISLQPASAAAGEPVAVRFDDTDGCFEVEASKVTRDGTEVTVNVLMSDVVVNPCPPQFTTPRIISLGMFEPGQYSVTVRLCVFFFDGDCFSETVHALQVWATARRATVPAVGWIALLLSCSGILALAFFTTRPGAPRR